MNFEIGRMGIGTVTYPGHKGKHSQKQHGTCSWKDIIYQWASSHSRSKRLLSFIVGKSGVWNHHLNYKMVLLLKSKFQQFKKPCRKENKLQWLNLCDTEFTIGSAVFIGVLVVVKCLAHEHSYVPQQLQFPLMLRTEYCFALNWSCPDVKSMGLI